RRLEGVEGDDDEVDGQDPVLLERVHIGGSVPPRQDAPMDLRVERLDAAVEHLGEAGDLGTVTAADAGFPYPRRGAARSGNAEAAVDEVHGGAEDPDAVRERLALGGEAGERGQE